ncbi:MAG: FkbM family methyltransferase [Verrucomicrobiota bacterium]
MNCFLQKIKSNTRLIKIPRGITGHFLEEDVLFYFKKYPQVYFDVGSNYGQSIRKFKQWNPNALIYGFEPCRNLFSKLSERYPSDSSVKMNPYALSDFTGVTTFNEYNKTGYNSLLEFKAKNSDLEKVSTYDVEVKTGDELCQRWNISHIDFLKIDTQGNDLAVVKGFQSLVKTQRIGMIYLESMVHPDYENQPVVSDVMEEMRKMGYQLFGIYEQSFADDHLIWCNLCFVPNRSFHLNDSASTPVNH